MVKIRLTKVGAKNERKFRIVVAPAKSKRDGAFLENLGFFLPDEKNMFKINRERYLYWLSKGAQPTKAVLKLIAQNGTK